MNREKKSCLLKGTQKTEGDKEYQFEWSANPLKRSWLLA